MCLPPSAPTFNQSVTTFKITGWKNELICREELFRLQVICPYVRCHVYIGLICCGIILATLKIARLSYERVGSGLNCDTDNITKRVID